MANKKKGRTSKLTVRFTPEEYKYFLVKQRESELSQADFILMLLEKQCEKEEK